MYYIFFPDWVRRTKNLASKWYYIKPIWMSYQQFLFWLNSWVLVGAKNKKYINSKIKFLSFNFIDLGIAVAIKVFFFFFDKDKTKLGFFFFFFISYSSRFEILWSRGRFLSEKNFLQFSPATLYNVKNLT